MSAVLAVAAVLLAYAGVMLATVRRIRHYEGGTWSWSR